MCAITRRRRSASLLATALLLSCTPMTQADLDAGGADRDGGAVDGGHPSLGDDDAGSPLPPATPDAACETNGCLRAVEEWGAYGRDEILPYVEPGVVVDNGYAIFRVRYFTDGREARAIVTLPDAIAPAGGFHVAVNNHGTTGLDDVCALGEGLGGVGLSGYFGARGFIGTAPDYPGLGTPGLHPYLVTEVEGRASLDAVRATLQLAALEGIPASGRAVITGLSQGGHATLAAAAEHEGYASELDVRAFAAAAPASCFLEQWATGMSFDGPHLVFHAMLIYAWAEHYGHDGPPLFTADVEADLDEIMSTRCLVDVSGGPTLFDALPGTRAELFDADFLAAYAGADLSEYPALSEAFVANRVRGFVQTAPLRIYQGTADTTVIEPHTKELVDELSGAGLDIDYVVVPNGGHVDVAFSFLAVQQLRTEEALGWLREQLAD